jgi:integrase
VLDEERAKGLSARTVVQARAVVGAAFRQAVAWGLIPANPVTATRPPRASRPALEVPNAAGLRRLIDAAVGSPWEVPILLAATTGARRGEILALRWSDLDLETGRLRVVRTLQHGENTGELVFLDPKTDRARRQLSLPPLAVERLRRHRVEQAERRLLIGSGWPDGDLVCDRGDGQPFRPDAFTRAFKRYAAQAGLPPETRLHDARHAVATTMLATGVHPAIASAVLGHSSPGFTMSTYQHVVDGMTDQAATALGDALEGTV